jgi:signal transduction histidine kinase
MLFLWLLTAISPAALAETLTGNTTSALPGPRAFEVTEVGRGQLVFHRPRTMSGEVEGFVIDSDLLVQTLKARVLEANGLGEVADVAPARSTGKLAIKAFSPSQGYRFTHRFSAPFSAVTADLHLRALDDPDEGALLNALAWGLALVILGGLFALYRMVATQIVFAERRSNFVSAVSHELKTPLTAIRMYGEMLQEGLVEDETKAQEYARTITSESERLTRLINNVLALSRIERRQPLTLRTDDVRPVVREVVEVLRPHASREGFTLELELPRELPKVLFEPDALRQVLFNLVDNALKYSRDARDKRVTVEATAEQDGGVTLSVRDRGPGVPEDQLSLIFEPFYRAEREITRKHKGTGIGLALVSGLVAGMRGSVSAVCPGNEASGLEVRVQLVSSSDGGE